jgi:hypothetical protein
MRRRRRQLGSAQIRGIQSRLSVIKPLVLLQIGSGYLDRRRLTDIHDMRMLHDILVHCDRGDPEEESAKDHSNDTRNPTEDTEEVIPVSFINRYLNGVVTHERDHDCAMMAKQTCSPASKQAVFCHDIVRSLISCSWSGRKECQLTPTNNAQSVPAATRAVMVSNESVPSVSVPRT